MSDNKTEWPEELPPGAEERKPNPFAGLPPEFAALAGLGDLAPMLTSTIAVYSQAGAEFLKWAKRLTSPSLVKLITATSAAGLEEKLNTFLQSDGIEVQRISERITRTGNELIIMVFYYKAVPVPRPFALTPGGAVVVPVEPLTPERCNELGEMADDISQDGRAESTTE